MSQHSIVNKFKKRSGSNVKLADLLTRYDISMADVCLVVTDRGYILTDVSDDISDDQSMTLNDFEALQQEIAEYNIGTGAHEIIVKHNSMLKYGRNDPSQRRPIAVAYFELKCPRHDVVPIEEVLKLFRILVDYSPEYDSVESMVDQYIQDVEGYQKAMNRAHYEMGTKMAQKKHKANV